MAQFPMRRAIYTDARQARCTFVSLSGDLKSRKAKKSKKTYLRFDQLAAGGFLYKCGIRDGDRLISVNFYPVQDVDFDLLIEAMSLLTPLMLHVERTVLDKVVPIIVIIDIRIDKDKEPYLRFHGFYWDVKVQMPGDSTTQKSSSVSSTDNKSYLSFDGCYWDSETLMMFKSPDQFLGKVKPMTTYRYFEKETNTSISTTSSDSYVLTVDDFQIRFYKSDSRGSFRGNKFTMHKYTSNKVNQNDTTPIILVPDEDPKQCLAATSEDVTLVPFNETEFTRRRSPLPENCRFLLLTEESPNRYTIESSVEAGQYFTRTDRDRLGLSTNATVFNIVN